MITFVNGYLCSSSCDVSKAKHGVDPHQQTDEVQISAKPEVKNGMVKADDAAVVFGGSLSALSDATAVPSKPVTPMVADAASWAQAINLLV